MKDKKLREALKSISIISISTEKKITKGFESRNTEYEINKLKDQIAGMLDFLAIEEVPYSERPTIKYYKKKNTVKGD